MILHQPSSIKGLSWKNVRGKLTSMAALDKLTWFGVGGPSEWLFEPADTQDLVFLLQNCPNEIPIHVLGAGSNTLVRDGGIKGITIKLNGLFTQITFESPNKIIAGAGASDAEVARFAASKEIAGLEFLIGIPGTIGGGLRMNAGANGGEFKDVLERAFAIDRNGIQHVVGASDLGMDYRHTQTPEDWIFTHAEFIGRSADKQSIREKMKQNLAHRADAQPIGKRTGGSTFANPEGHKAWQLIEAAGCRGLRIGNAQVSDKHCNFLINNGQATASDLEALGLEVCKRVRKNSGIELRWEIKRIGLNEDIQTNIYKGEQVR